MAGLYIHIPFCNEKCYYCDFYSGNQLYLLDDYIDALVKEIELRSGYLSGNVIGTIYFGGGTPSLMSKYHFSKIINEIYLRFEVANKVEITMECNPENIDIEYVNDLWDCGINRISLGVQFLDDEILNSFNRKHSKDIIINSLNVLNNSFFSNLSVDIIFSVPGISDSILLDSLELLLQFDIKHISAYSLTISKNSKLFWKVQSGEIIESKEESFLSQYEVINKFVLKNDFFQYEVSNYAREGYLSLHNFNYWNQVPYLGIGVSAHSYNVTSRQWNHTNIKRYIRELEAGIIDFEFEELSQIQVYNEYIILKLRTFQGFSVNYIENSFSKEIVSHFRHCIDILLKENHFIVIENLIICKESDLLIADYLAKKLMY